MRNRDRIASPLNAELARDLGLYPNSLTFGEPNSLGELAAERVQFAEGQKSDRNRHADEGTKLFAVSALETNIARVVLRRWPPPSTSSGRPTLFASRSPAGAGTICRPWLDDFSRYIVAWRLGPTMCASDVTATLDQALAASGMDHALIKQRPRLLSDNGSSYVADDLATWLKGKDMPHVRGAPYHPQTQGKIERWHQTLKNRILLENYYLPGDLERQIGAFVEHYNHVRYHESIDNLTPADVYFGRAETILVERSASSLRLSQTVACSIGCRPLKL